MNQSSNKKPLWIQLVMESAPIVNEATAEFFYHRAAAAWGSGQSLEIADGMGGWVDLTKLFEQYRMLQILKGNE